MDDKQSLLDTLMRQANLHIEEQAYIPKTNRYVGYASTGDPLADGIAHTTTTLRGMSEGPQGPNLRIDELSTIRKLLEQCTIDATRREVIHVLEAVCAFPEECIGCPYKNSLGECNRNERIADILLNRFGRVK